MSDVRYRRRIAWALERDAAIRYFRPIRESQGVTVADTEPCHPDCADAPESGSYVRRHHRPLRADRASIVDMRLNLGITLAHADETLRAAQMTWQNARGGTFGFYRAYTEAVNGTYPQLKQVFVTPDLAAGLRSTAYWNLLRMGDPRQGAGFITDPAVAQSHQSALSAINNAFSAEIDNQVAVLAQAHVELTKLKTIATRPGLPIIYDTNMLIAWQQPTMIGWQEVLKAQGETLTRARLVVPLRVVDELDRQKYGDGKLAARAGAALRYLQNALAAGDPGDATKIRNDASLEIWVDTEDRGGDADLAILRCASDLAGLHPDTGARVLTGDLGMQLRAQQMDLKVLHLPDNFRKVKEETALR